MAYASVTFKSLLPLSPLGYCRSLEILSSGHLCCRWCWWRAPGSSVQQPEQENHQTSHVLSAEEEGSQGVLEVWTHVKACTCRCALSTFMIVWLKENVCACMCVCTLFVCLVYMCVYTVYMCVCCLHCV